VFGLCILAIGIGAAVFFVYYRFAGGNIVDFFATLLRGDKDEEKNKVPPVPPPPQLRDMAKQSNFDNTLTQQMLNNEVKTGHAVNSAYSAAPYPPTATGTYPAQNAPYPPPASANRPNTGYPPPNTGYPPPASAANRAGGQPPPSSYPPARPPASGYPAPAAQSGFPSSPNPLPPAVPNRDPFSGVQAPPNRESALGAPQSAEQNRNQGYVPNPGDPGDDFLGGLDDDIGL
jgi:hypothetical protein